MNNVGQLLSDLVYKNVLFQKILPKIFPQLILPMVHLVTPRTLSIQSFYLYFTLGFIILLIIIYSIRKILIIKRYLDEDSVILEITPPAVSEKTAYTTEQLFKAIHDLGLRRSIWDKILDRKVRTSFEIVSTLHEGIRYLVRTTPDEERNIKNNLLSYLPQIKVKKVDDYLENNSNSKIIEFKLSRHFAYPLKKQENLEEHDPVAYITGMMTKLSEDELISYQIVISPIEHKESGKILEMIFNNKDTLKHLDRFVVPSYLKLVSFIFIIMGKIIYFIGGNITEAITEIVHGSDSAYKMQYYNEIQDFKKPERIPNTFEQQTVRSVQDKISKPLFETSIRLLVAVNDENEQKQRVKGFISAFAPFAVPQYQSLKSKRSLLNIVFSSIKQLTFKKRLLSLIHNSSSNYLSVSEISDLYHFPFMRVTQTENIVKVHSKDLPAPISLKNGRKLDVIFGENSYGGSTTPIGLTNEERKTHMYIIGRTGSGKTTLMFSMAKQDIENGQGFCFIDPHGDISDDLLACVPEKRKDDLIFFNPFDLKHPVGINLLELTPGLDEDEAELEKEVVAEGVISLFRKVFSKEENTNAHRIEYILRNTIHTAFTVPDATIFTVYDLLNNPPFQKEVIAKLQDENLKNFWNFEFGRAGGYQIVKMVGGVTAKIGRFLFSPTAKRILEQKKSTINFDEILNGKILICKLSQGKLGEDTAKLLGTTILTKLQQAALKRADIPQSKRRQFHLYVDEFQNFATTSFIKLLSEGRKYGLDVCIAEQSTSQQEDRSIVNIILGNVTTVICFRSGNPVDEQLLLAQMSPYIEQGEILNLPRYKFYIKISAIESEEPFSGQTLKIDVQKNNKLIEKLLESSRKNNAITSVKPVVEIREVSQPQISNGQKSKKSSFVKSDDYLTPEP